MFIVTEYAALSFSSVFLGFPYKNQLSGTARCNFKNVTFNMAFVLNKTSKITRNNHLFENNINDPIKIVLQYRICQR